MRNVIVLVLIAVAALILPPISHGQNNPKLRQIKISFDSSIDISLREPLVFEIQQSGVLPNVEEPYDQLKIDKATWKIVRLCADQGISAKVDVQTIPVPDSKGRYEKLLFLISRR